MSSNDPALAARGAAPRVLQRVAPIALNLVAVVVLGAVAAAGVVMLVPTAKWAALGYHGLTYPLQLLGLSVGLLAVALVTRWVKQRLAAALFLASGLLAAGLAIGPSAALFRFARQHDMTPSVATYVANARKRNYGPPARARSVTYHVAEDGTRLELDVWRSRRAPGLRPAIVIVHGGGWAGGNRSDAPLWNEWLNELGYHVFDVDYRLAPPAPHRNQVADVKCALGWVTRHATEYGVDTARLGVFGRSAGANLVLLAAYTASDPLFPPSCDVPAVGARAVVNLYGPVDLKTLYEAGPYYVQAILSAYLGGAPSAFPERYVRWSPLTHVRPSVPPTLTLSGESDRIIPSEQARLLASALSRVGATHETYVLPYTDHSFDLNWGGFSTQIARAALERFLKRHLSAEAPSQR
jgi:acetyl esterase/lipase